MSKLRDALSYDPITGSFIWKNPIRAALKGRIAGCINGFGYRVIRVEGKDFYAHRLAWLYVTGKWPKTILDHIDGNPDNNAFVNLREATKAANGANRGKQANNTTGFKGVRKHFRKWVAQITIDGVNTYLGIFDSPEEASAAYELAAKQEYGEFARHV